MNLTLCENLTLHNSHYFHPPHLRSSSPPMDGPMGVGQGQPQDQQQTKAVERLNPAVQQQLNLESVKTRAVSLFKAITRILEDFDVIARTNSNPKWQDVLGQFSMVNLELYNIVEDIKKVSKAFVVHPKNVNGENAAILPVMISSKLLPEIEADDTSKREQLLYAMQNLSMPSQIEKLKARIDMIGAACESAEKVIADTRKTYFGTRQGPTNIMTLDKAQAAKIQEQENLLRHAVNQGQGLRLPPDQRQITSALPPHLVDVLPVGDNAQTVSESSGMYMKNTPPMVTNAVNNQGVLMQGSGSQLMGRAAASPGGTGTQSFDNTTASPLPYANSPRSAANMMNTPSPQQQQQQQQQTQQQQQQQQFQQQQRQRLMQLPQHQQQQILAQQFRQNPMAGLAQNQLSQLHDLQGQGQQKYQLHGQNQMQYSQSLGAQQFQGRQLPSGGMQHGIAQNQLNQGSQLNRINQMSSAANSALFNAAQGTPNNQMMSNMSAMMPSQPLVPRMQFGLSGGNRTLGSQNMSDQAFNMGAANPNTMMPMQQQQQQQQQQLGSQGAFGNMQQNAQNLQANMMQNQQQNFQQHRQNNQQ